nr:DUF1003 domain-containing protein [Actinomycetales bacterium]
MSLWATTSTRILSRCCPPIRCSGSPVRSPPTTTRQSRWWTRRSTCSAPSRWTTCSTRSSRRTGAITTTTRRRTVADRLDTPRETRFRLPRISVRSEAVNAVAEGIARFTGTPQFLIWLTVFVILWLGWNSLAPEDLRFDSAALGFTALTLMLSLQASYAAPLILLAQNRQDDRDRVIAEQDRRRAERNLADTEYVARELASLRMSLGEVATRDYVRGELRDMMADLLADRDVRDERFRAELLELLRHPAPPVDGGDSAAEGGPSGGR